MDNAMTIHRPERLEVEAADSVDIEQALEQAYGATLRLKVNRTDGQAAPLRLARTDVGRFSIDEVDVPIELEASPDPLNKVVVVWATRGKLSGRCGDLVGGADAGEISLMSQPDLGHHAHGQDFAATSALLDHSLVASVAAGVPIGEAPLPVRFSRFTPLDDVAVQRWKATVRYVQNCVLADEDFATPLVLGHVSRLLAAVTLATFPNTATPLETPADRTDIHPVLLRRAIEFMESNLANDIGLGDIANAVHVTPRAVQYMFRRHLDTTPLQHLRRLRLHHAHLDLMAADRMRDTVTNIAGRWGFSHTGRFAVLYRETYGQSPHRTLRE